MDTTPLALAPAYTSEQQSAIDALMASRVDAEPYCYFEWSSGLVSRGSQQFAIFGKIANELAPPVVDDSDVHIEYVPIVIDGRLLKRSPDEGPSGVAYLMRVSRHNGQSVADPTWHGSYVPCGWLYATELGMTNDEIAGRIADEVDRGLLRITGGRES